jgi:glycosyltransferase involved in cell wall biosynthesis
MSRVLTPNVRDALSHAPSSSPRALFLINDLRMGGAERSLVNFVNHLRHITPAVVLIDPAAESLLGELSPELELFSLHRHPPKISAAELQIASAGASHRRRGRPRGQMLLELPGLLKKARRLARLVRTTDARVVSTFLNRSHTIALLSKVLFAPRMRVVINVHEMLSDHLDRYFSPLERRFMRAFIRYGFPRAQRIIAVSDGVKHELVRHFAIPPASITVLPNPIDVERIRLASAEMMEGGDTRQPSVLIVGVGRLVRLKGFDVLIRAFARLREPVRARLLIIGDGEERPYLERLVAELQVTDRVTFIGTQTNPWKYMARAAVVALPSRSEAFPNVIGEALALSLPVIATHCSAGVTEYLEGGRYGVLIPPDDVDALAAALERVLTDAKLRRRLAQHGASRAEAFDLPHVVERYERLIVEAAHG